MKKSFVKYSGRKPIVDYNDIEILQFCKKDMISMTVLSKYISLSNKAIIFHVKRLIKRGLIERILMGKYRFISTTRKGWMVTNMFPGRKKE